MPASQAVKTHAIGILSELGSCPAVSFLEDPVAARIETYLQDMGLAVDLDAYGNLIAHLSGRSDYEGDKTPIAFVAHMDHPGFEAVELKGNKLIARALGGVPQSCFTDRVPVQVVMPGGERLRGETAGSYGRKDQRMVSVQLPEAIALEFPRAVVFDLPDFHFQGELIHMRAADDLVGCAGIITALHMLASEEVTGAVFGVFTRAEEVGLIGARLIAEERLLPEDTIVVSIEASKSLPGAAIGEGPVIRVGDASLTFDAEAEAVLVRAKEELTEKTPGFRAQRQLMSGGTCEASAFRFHGYRTTGVAIPLGNYHNATPEGGVGAEYVHVEDFLGGVELIAQAARCVARRKEARPWKRMRDLDGELRRRLAANRPVRERRT